MTLKQVADKFNLCEPTIIKILNEYNISRYKKATLFNPNLKEHFFQEINNEAAAYYLGLIVSDGNVFKSSDNRQHSMSITLDLKDEYLLEKFKELVGANTSIGHNGRGCGQVAVRSDIMANDLAQYGITPRKSFHTYLPSIPEEWMPHFIRGVYDGDGSVRAQQRLCPDGRNRFEHAISFCGTHKLMTDISEYLNNHLNLKTQINVYDYKNKTLSEFKIANAHDIIEFGKFIYKDATIFMKRKHDGYIKIYEHYRNIGGEN